MQPGKFGLTYLIFFFLASAVWQYFTEGSVRWVDNFGVAFVMLILLVLYEWTKTSSIRKKEGDSQ